jgi:hypothetical protein
MNDLFIQILIVFTFFNFCKSANITLETQNLFQNGDNFLINVTYSLSSDETFNYLSIFMDNHQLYNYREGKCE